jgi:excisionase family DNA binding protein
METTTEKAAFSVDASCSYLDISRPTLYRLMDLGEIRNFHIGRRRLILREDLEKFLQDRLAESASGSN